MKIKLRPFITPNFVIAEMPSQPRQFGFCEAPKFYLKDVDAQSLDELCNEFRAEIFKKAGKTDPKSLKALTI